MKERTEFAQKSVASLVQKTLPTVEEKDEKSLLLNPLLWLFSLATLFSGKPRVILIYLVPRVMCINHYTTYCEKLMKVLPQFFTNSKVAPT